MPNDALQGRQGGVSETRLDNILAHRCILRWREDKPVNVSLCGKNIGETWVEPSHNDSNIVSANLIICPDMTSAIIRRIIYVSRKYKYTQRSILVLGNSCFFLLNFPDVVPICSSIVVGISLF